MKGYFRPTPVNGSSAYMPYVRAAVTHNGIRSIEVDALLDTGASINLISMDSATALMNMSPDEIRKGRRLPVSGVGGANSTAYGWQVDLQLRATSKSSDTVTWEGVWLYVSENRVPFAHILIGQLHGFESKVFVHLNRPPNRYWLLRT